MTTRRSSADPAALSQFATATLDALATLRGKSGTVTGTLGTLASAASDVDLPTGTDVAAELDDLVTDWEHLGGFARDVANGFYWLLSERGYHGGVVTFADASLTRLGIVGYADRDEAIADAEAMADRFRALRAEGYDGVTAEAMADLLAMAERGRFDPAFAVAFSEAIGVAGYVDLTAMIRHAHQRGGIYEPVPPAGLDMVEVLATTLTTALATLPGLPPGEGLPGTGGWPRDQRLDPSFLDALAGGFDVEAGRANTDFPVRTETDLSVLLSFAAPPTSVAVAIANGRLSPLLRDPERPDARPGDEGADWGDHGGRITNYATMLGRDPDASARWLDAEVRGTRNIDLVLQRNPDFGLVEGGRDIDVDGGRALARVVDHGVTHHDDALRGRLMERAIEVVGGEQDEIRNRHLPDVLARGVARNMDVVDRLVTTGWDDPHAGEDPPAGARDTHDFLVEVLRDGTAAPRVLAALEDHGLDRLRELAAPGVDADGDGRHDRTARLEQVGMVQGVFVAAEGNVVSDSVEAYIGRQEAKGDAVNLMVGLIPYADGVIGTVNDVADVYGSSAGDRMTPDTFREFDEAEQVTHMIRTDALVNNRVLVAAAGMPEGEAAAVRDMTPDERRSWAERLRDEAQDYDAESHLNAGMSYAVTYFDAQRWGS